MTREEAKRIIEKVRKYNFVGIRGTEEPMKIGQVVGNSYDWDFSNDQSSFFSEIKIELEGACATLACTADWINFFRDEEDDEEAIDFLLDAIRFNQSEYSYDYTYVIVSNVQNPFGFDENDDREIILKEAVVIVEV